MISESEYTHRVMEFIQRNKNKKVKIAYGTDFFSF